MTVEGTENFCGLSKQFLTFLLADSGNSVRRPVTNTFPLTTRMFPEPNKNRL